LSAVPVIIQMQLQKPFNSHCVLLMPTENGILIMMAGFFQFIVVKEPKGIGLFAI
jgi:hypothetical protein